MFGKLTGKYRYASALIGDSRMKMITNLIEGIRIVKLYGWECPYLDALFLKRGLEVIQLKKKALVSCFNRMINFGSAGLVIFVTFSVYVILGNELKPATVFSSVAVLMQCTNLLSMIGTAGITQIFLIVTSMKRFTQCLLLKNRKNVDYEATSTNSLIASNCCFSWKEPEVTPKDDNELTKIKEKKLDWSLKNINFSCKPGELIIVIGAVGSGKTALFMGLLKEICTLEGNISLNGKISLASEEP